MIAFNILLPRVVLRSAAGAIGLLGLGTNHVSGLRALAAENGSNTNRGTDESGHLPIFLSGGLAQHDSFDPKPDAPENIRGEFNPIATRTSPGISICEHLPLLASRSDRWAAWFVPSRTHTQSIRRVIM